MLRTSSEQPFCSETVHTIAQTVADDPSVLRFHQEHWDKLEAPVGVSMQEGIAVRGKKISEMWHAASQEEREVCMFSSWIIHVPLTACSQRYVDEYKKEVAEYQKREAEQAAAALAQSS